jgi:two-component sensor histidine kinase
VQSAMAPSDARTIVRRMCSEMHVEDLTDTAALLTSELVTNAVRHGSGPLHLDVACTRGHLVVSVFDSDPAPPKPRRAHPREPGGRGLSLVESLSEHWGFRQLPDDGKAVWFTLRPDTPPVQDACDCHTEQFDSEVPSIPISRSGI